MKSVPVRMVAENVDLEVVAENDRDLVRLTIQKEERGVRLSGTISREDAERLGGLLIRIAAEPLRKLPRRPKGGE